MFNRLKHFNNKNKQKIEQFNPDQFTINQAKVNATKVIEDAIQRKIDEINARTDLTDKEKKQQLLN